MNLRALFANVSLKDLRRVTLDTLGVAGFLIGMYCLIQSNPHLASGETAAAVALATIVTR